MRPRLVGLVDFTRPSWKSLGRAGNHSAEAGAGIDVTSEENIHSISDIKNLF